MNNGILYSYIKAAIFDNSEYEMDVVDNLRYNTTDFLKNIKANLSLENNSDEHIDIINLFCICATKEEIKKIQGNIIQEIIDRISFGDNFELKYNSSDIYNKFINTFVCYLLDNNLSPLIFSFDIDNLSILYFFGSSRHYKQPPPKIKEVFYIWLNREKPILLGKQVITQSFYYKNLVGRKTLDIISNYNTDDFYLLLEGNIKIKLDYNIISSLNYLDTNNFNVNDLQRILYEPIYCFGYTFESSILFFDWFDVYLYLIALLNIDLENTEKLKQSYMAFLAFIEQNICEKIYANSAVFDEIFFYDILKIHIQNIIEFLKRYRRIKYF